MFAENFDPQKFSQHNLKKIKVQCAKSRENFRKILRNPQKLMFRAQLRSFAAQKISFVAAKQKQQKNIFAPQLFSQKVIFVEHFKQHTKDFCAAKHCARHKMFRAQLPSFAAQKVLFVAAKQKQQKNIFASQFIGFVVRTFASLRKISIRKNSRNTIFKKYQSIRLSQLSISSKIFQFYKFSEIYMFTNNT